MAQPIDFSSEISIPTIGATAFLKVAAWPSGEERSERLVKPLDTLLRKAGAGRVESVSDKADSSEHFLTGVVSYFDRVEVELNSFRSDFPKLEAALRELGFGGEIYYVLADGRDAISVVSPTR